ncbi:MAG: NrtA/SsuA/CpmA family ABC transporter substrate-binding protein [Thalassobaculaceae bacterium]|nr:NrtA/SsuA/CpmA family ABC transporter substrate-binding protein [Thalassobaculaceae bacterium]
MTATHQNMMRPCIGHWLRRGISCLVCALTVLLAPPAIDSVAAEPFRVGTSPTGILVWIAKDLGIFEANGVEVEVRHLSSGVEALDTVQNGEVDLGASSEFAFISRAIHDPSLCIFATISASRTIRLLSRADRVGPRTDELRGKRIGVTFGAASRFFLWQYLTLAGISENEVVLVDLSPAQVTEAMVTGTVDAGIVWEPHVTNIRKQVDVGLVEYADQSDQHYYFTLQGKCDLAERKPDALRRVLKSLVDAERRSIEAAAEARAAFAQRFGLSEEEAERIWNLHTLSVSLSQDLLFLMELETKWRASSGLDPNSSIDSLERIEAGPLSDVAPNAVQIIR